MYISKNDDNSGSYIKNSHNRNYYAGIAPFSFIIKEKFDMLREALPEIVTGSVPGAKAKAILDRRNE